MILHVMISLSRGIDKRWSSTSWLLRIELSIIVSFDYICICRWMSAGRGHARMAGFAWRRWKHCIRVHWLSSGALHSKQIIETITKLDSLRWFSQRRSPMPHCWGCPPCADFPDVVAQCHILGGVHPGGYDPQFRSRPRLLYNAPIILPRVSSSYVYSFGSHGIDKQTDVTENIQRFLLHYDFG